MKLTIVASLSILLFIINKNEAKLIDTEDNTEVTNGKKNKKDYEDYDVSGNTIKIIYFIHNYFSPLLIKSWPGTNYDYRDSKYVYLLLVRCRYSLLPP